MLTIRVERPEDIPWIRAVNEPAFGQPDEAALVDAVRACGEWSISLVAVDGKRLAGHILFTPVTIQGPDRVREAVGLGPLAVDPDYQRHGIGSQLVVQGLDLCRESGHRIAVVLGHPTYYPRFGFVPARLHGIRFQLDVPDDAFMVIALEPGALDGCTGVARYVAEFMSL
jgi:putative acetyltransferase